MSTLGETLKNFYATVAIDSIIEGLVEQGVSGLDDVDRDALAAKFDAVYNGAAAPAVAAPRVSPPSTVPAAAKTGKKSSGDGSVCKFVLTRGRRGDYCGKTPTTGDPVNGEPRCKSHSGKESTLPYTGEGGAPPAATKSAPKSGAAKGKTQPPPPPAARPTIPKARGLTTLNVVAVPGKNYQIIKDTQIAVRIDPKGRTALGTHDPETKELLPYLSESLRNQAKMFKFDIPDDLPFGPADESELGIGEDGTEEEAAEEAQEEVAEEAVEEAQEEVAEEPAEPEPAPPAKRPIPTVPGRKVPAPK